MPSEPAAVTETAASFPVMEVILVASAVVISVLVYLLLRRSLGGLLDDVVKLPAARKFFLRTLLVVLIFSALAATVGVSPYDSDEASFMERVWDVAESLESAFWAVMVVLLVYTVLQTIIVAALGRRHEQ